MKSEKKATFLKQYCDISFQLGRLASLNDLRLFGISREQVRTRFVSLTKLREAAIGLHPDLQKLAVAPLTSLGAIEAHRFDLEKRIAKNLNNETLRNSNFFEYAEQFADKVFKGRIKVKAPKKAKSIKRVHTLVLSDLHFGADLRSDETGTADYGVVEEARRFASIIREAAKYKEQYRKDTKLVIILGGDIIENSMHDPRTGAVISEQCCRAIHLLAQGISYLASFYPEVQVECVTGNHDRITSRHHGRAIHQKFDSYSTIIYYALKSTLSEVKHVTVHIPKTPLSDYKVFGKRIGVTHGDTVIKAGGIYSTVNVKGLEAQINKINSSLLDTEEYAAIIYGHTHIAHVIHLANGCILIGNGSLPPPDPFAVSLGNFESNNSQWMFESVEGHPVGDMRAIKTGKNYDTDQSLDSIIKPWPGF